jgi:hypothetical protein
MRPDFPWLSQCRGTRQEWGCGGESRWGWVVSVVQLTVIGTQDRGGRSGQDPSRILEQGRQLD